jgi:hypothetical protein
MPQILVSALSIKEYLEKTFKDRNKGVKNVQKKTNLLSGFNTNRR